MFLKQKDYNQHQILRKIHKNLQLSLLLLLPPLEDLQSIVSSSSFADEVLGKEISIYHKQVNFLTYT